MSSAVSIYIYHHTPSGQSRIHRCFVVPEHREYARWCGLGGRFIPDDIVGVHTLSLLAPSRVAHDHATDNHYPDQHNIQYTKYSRLTYSRSESGSNLDREVLNPFLCG